MYDLQNNTALNLCHAQIQIKKELKSYLKFKILFLSQ